MNPILDSCRFWRGLEILVNRFLGIKKRNDDMILSLVLAEEPDFLGDALRERSRKTAVAVDKKERMKALAVDTRE